jgi:hypothetical protein
MKRCANALAATYLIVQGQMQVPGVYRQRPS